LVQVNNLIASYRSAQSTLELQFVQRPSDFTMRRVARVETHRPSTNDR
jgi:hypothetical protein